MRKYKQTRATMAHDKSKLGSPSRNLSAVSFLMEKNKITYEYE